MPSALSADSVPSIARAESYAERARRVNANRQAAALATFFIGREAAVGAVQSGRGEPASGKELAAMRAEIAALREDIAQAANRSASA